MPDILVELQRVLGGHQGQQSQFPQLHQQPPASSTPTGDPAITAVLQQVLKQYPGLAKNFNAQNILAVLASGDRAQRGIKERGGLEFWHPEGEPVATGGDPTYPTPQLGKNVLEIYDKTLANNPAALQQAIYGDLMHGMTADPYWNGLRSQFMQGFTPQEQQRQKEHETWWEDVNGDSLAESQGKIGHNRGDGAYDAYIRGWIADEGGGKQGQQESKGTMYSPQQLQELKQMQDYLNTGKAQQPAAPKGAQQQ